VNHGASVNPTLVCNLEFTSFAGIQKKCQNCKEETVQRARVVLRLLNKDSPPYFFEVYTPRSVVGMERRIAPILLRLGGLAATIHLQSSL
jgi:hypothetical protein